MDLKQAQRNINNFLNELDNNRENDTLLIAKEARALIVRRVQNTGKDYRDKQMGTYSTNPLPLFYYDQILSKSQQLAAKKLQKIKGGVSYKDARKIAGRRTNFVDLTFSGAMWAGTVAIIDSQTPNSVTATITGRTQETRDKLEYNSIRYGNVLRLTDEEERQLEKARLDRINSLLGRYFK
jgi:hypothetical protein